MAKSRKILISIFAAICCVCLALSFVPFTAALADGESQSTADAYFVYEDRETLGMWYTGKDGTKANRETNRVYGKSGVVLPYHGQTDEGNAMVSKNPTDFSDNSETYAPMKTPHYVEYPEWISKVEMLSGNPAEVWNNHIETIASRAYSIAVNNATDQLGLVKQPLYIDFYDQAFIDLYDANGNGETDTDEKRHGAGNLHVKDATFSFTATDDDWHLFTAYVGSVYAHNTITYYEARVRLYDMNDKLLTDNVITNSGYSAYLTYAVKGSFKVRIDSNGYEGTGANGFFFDAMPTNSEIGVSNLTATLEGAKRVNLAWTNQVETSYTNIYRRIKGAEKFEYLTTVEPGVSTYSDDTTKVSTLYEYTAVSGTRTEYSKTDRSWDYHGYAMTGYTDWEHGIDKLNFNFVDGSVVAECQTAPYTLTYVEFLEKNLGCEIGTTLSTKVKVYLNPVYDEKGNFVSGTPYANAAVHFSIDGEKVYNAVQGTLIPNMQTEFGSVITDANGEATFSFLPQYVGEYSIKVQYDEAPDPNDPLQGFDSCSAQTDFVVYAEEQMRAPVLFTVSDAIKPGDAFNVTGNFIMGGNYNQVYYAPATGEANRKFDWNIPGLNALSEEDIVIEDSTFNTGLMAIFPKDAQPGIYDIWVENAFGVSTAITMNKARPLFMSQDGGYAGLPIEVVGRNFLASEFLGTDDAKVKLVRVGDLRDVDDGVRAEYVVDINTGVKWAAEDTFVGEEIQISNPYRIEFTIPDDIIKGTYVVYVSNMGDKGYVRLDGEQTLKIYDKKAADYDETVFGPTTTAHIGNDPLDLKVYWAQDFNYSNIATVPGEHRWATNDFEAGGGYAKHTALNDWLTTTLARLAQQGGGVVYFPDGYYYLDSIELPSNVLMVGQSVENTILYIKFKADTPTQNYFNFIRANEQRNVGIARFTIAMPDKNVPMPDMICVWDSTNMAVSDVYFDLVLPDELTERSQNRGMGLYHGEHLVYQNVVWRGEYTALYLDDTHYTMIRNCDFEIRGLNNGMGFKYAFLENTSYKSGSQGHGWCGRDTAYCAYNYVQDIGRKENANNKGEVFYFEPPASVQSIGNVLSATDRTFTIYTKRGDVLDPTTELGYNQCAIQITDGMGAGQIRYFEKAPIASADGVTYGNTYQLCSWERAWDVLPDHTSKFSIFEPMTKHTIINNSAVDCAKSLMLFSQCSDGLILGNHLLRTEGIQVWNDTASDCQATNMYVRIEGNVVDGVSLGTGNGGIEILAGNGSGYWGINDIGVVIRDNTVKNIRNYEGRTGSSEHTKYNAGINLFTRENVTTFAPGSIRMVIVENNVIENCEFGIRSDARIYGVLAKNNMFSDIGINGDVPEDAQSPEGMGTTDITILNTVEFHAISKLTFVVDGQANEKLSREFTYGEALPVLDGAFIGWAKTPTVTSKDQVLTTSDGGVSTLYPIFGHKVELKWNYSGKDVYREYNVLAGEVITSLGRPVRVGYDFEGWFTDQACTNAFQSGTEINQDYTLYAKWVSRNAAPTTPNDGEEEKKGCKGSITAASAVVMTLVCLGAVAVVALKKKNG